MRNWHALVLLLCCGCSMDTTPLTGGVAIVERDTEDAGAFASVSFRPRRRHVGPIDLPRNAMRLDDADGGTAYDDDSGTRDRATHGSDKTTVTPHDAPAESNKTPARAAQPGPAPDAPSSGRTKDANHPEPDNTSPTTAPPSDLPDSGLPTSPPTSEPAGTTTDTGGDQPAPSEAGSADMPSEPEDWTPAADSSSDTDSAPSEPESTPAMEAPDTPEQQAARARLLDLMHKTLYNAFDPYFWSPESLALAATVSSLSGLPENQRTRPVVAGLLIRLRQTNACRFDNPDDCAEICASLTNDCAVCRWDSTCQVSVELLCAAQASFSCRPYQ
jgi:hypothetical protein